MLYVLPLALRAPGIDIVVFCLFSSGGSVAQRCSPHPNHYCRTMAAKYLEVETQSRHLRPLFCVSPTTEVNLFHFSEREHLRDSTTNMCDGGSESNSFVHLNGVVYNMRISRLNCPAWPKAARRPHNVNSFATILSPVVSGGP
jgi:hypothetical protein